MGLLDDRLLTRLYLIKTDKDVFNKHHMVLIIKGVKEQQMEEDGSSPEPTILLHPWPTTTGEKGKSARLEWET